MKTRHFLIIGGFILILGLVYLPILSNEKEEEDNSEPTKTTNYIPVTTAINKSQNITVTSYGQVMPNNQIDITMEVQGVIETGGFDLKVGRSFKKHDILIKIERVEALYNLLARRSSFINLISTLIPDIALDFPEEKEKWESFLYQLEPSKQLPNLPNAQSKKEKLLINAKNISSEYYSIKGLENQIEKYYYLAPFNGTVISSNIEPGALVSPGLTIATIAKTNDHEVKAPINIADLELFKNAKEVLFTNPQGVKIGKGKLKRTAKSINQQTQSIDAFFSIYPTKGSELIQGMFLNLSITSPLHEESVLLPNNAIVDNKVQLLKDSLIQVKDITTVGAKGDSIYVIGIKDSAKVVLSPHSTPEDSLKFIGVQK